MSRRYGGQEVTITTEYSVATRLMKRLCGEQVSNQGEAQASSWPQIFSLPSQVIQFCSNSPLSRHEVLNTNGIGSDKPRKTVDNDENNKKRGGEERRRKAKRIIRLVGSFRLRGLSTLGTTGQKQGHTASTVPRRVLRYDTVAFLENEFCLSRFQPTMYGTLLRSRSNSRQLLIDICRS
jgi:hypothetical protein